MKSLTNLTDEVYTKVRLLGQAWGVSDDEVIRRLLERFLDSAQAAATDTAAAGTAPTTEIRVHAIFEKVRTDAVFDRTTKSVTIVGGPLAGQSFATPSGAASAIIRRYRPDISPSRNGWTFWTVSSDGKLLQSVR